MTPILIPLLARVNTLLTRLSSTRATNLDNLDAAISAISPIRSVQRGSIVIGNGSGSNTATISSVSTGKTSMALLGVAPASGTSGIIDVGVYVDLTNSTTVTASRNGTTGAVTVRYQVVEFK